MYVKYTAPFLPRQPSVYMSPVTWPVETALILIKVYNMNTSDDHIATISKDPVCMYTITKASKVCVLYTDYS